MKKMGISFPVLAKKIPKRLPQLLCIITFANVVLSNAIQAQIGLPPPPRPILPPNAERHRQPRTDEDRASEMPDALRQRRDQRLEEQKAVEPKPPTPSEIKEQALKEEAIKSRPFNFMAAVDFIFPQVSVSGGRKNYTADMTAHHYGLFRLGPSEESSPPESETNIWIGYRIAPFSGSGQAGSSAGRYGFTYFGPMIALGKFSPGARSVGQSTEGSEEDGEHGLQSLSREGIMLATGISGLSKNGTTDPGAEDPFEDFQSKPMVFESPGIFVQLQYIHVMYGALGIDYVVGAQLGKGKTFMWGGLGVSAFH